MADESPSLKIDPRLKMAGFALVAAMQLWIILIARDGDIAIGFGAMLLVTSPVLFDALEEARWIPSGRGLDWVRNGLFLAGVALLFVSLATFWF